MKSSRQREINTLVELRNLAQQIKQLRDSEKNEDKELEIARSFSILNITEKDVQGLNCEEFKNLSDLMRNRISLSEEEREKFQEEMTLTENIVRELTSTNKDLEEKLLSEEEIRIRL
jgi:hypothetical protein